MTAPAPTGAAIRAAIVDDEPLARERLRTLLARVEDVRVVGEYASGSSAVGGILKTAPDLLFLDVQMPGMSGFDVLDAVAGEVRPAVIFVTAYDQYALRAFEVHAQDYLLKPFDEERFLRALHRARIRIGHERSGALNERLVALLEEMRREAAGRRAEPAAEGRERRRRLDRLVVKSGGRISFVAVDEVDWIESADNYVRVHARGAVHLVRDTLARLESALDPDRFLRVHRSRIVNVARIREVQPWFNGEYVLVLHDGSKLHSSRGYREAMARLLGG